MHAGSKLIKKVLGIFPKNCPFEFFVFYLLTSFWLLFCHQPPPPITPSPFAKNVKKVK